MASSFALSALGGGSRQFIITLEENVKTQIPRGVLIDTGSRINAAVSTAITLLSFDETPQSSSSSGGITFIRSESSSTGKGALIPLSGKSFDSYSGNSGYSAGASTIFVSTAGSGGEKVYLTYDTATMGKGSLQAPIVKSPHLSAEGEFKVFFSSPSTFVTVNLPINWTGTNNVAADLLFIVPQDSPSEVWIATRKHSAVYDALLSNYTSTADEDCMKIFASNSNTINIKFADIVSGIPVDFIPEAPNAGIWTAFKVYASNPNTAGILNLLFGSTTPVNGTETISQISQIIHFSTKRKAVKCVFNAVEVVGGEQSRYGFGMMSR